MGQAERMTTAEVADFLGLSVATINRRAAAGLLPHDFKAPGSRGAYFFNRHAVEMYARTLAGAVS